MRLLIWFKNRIWLTVFQYHGWKNSSFRIIFKLQSLTYLKLTLLSSSHNDIDNGETVSKYCPAARSFKWLMKICVPSIVLLLLWNWKTYRVRMKKEASKKRKKYYVMTNTEKSPQHIRSSRIVIICRQRNKRELQ